MPDFVAPTLDLHALAPEFVLAGVVCVLLLLDVVLLDRAKAIVGSIAGLGLLGSLVPILTLATSDHPTRTMFGGAYVVDSTSLLLKALFIVSAYVVVLLSTNYIGEGDYWESEYYTLLVSSVLGMTVMASALELLSIPAYMLAAWSKRDGRSNEAGMKYYLMGVFASAILLYGMSLLYGWSGSTQLSEIGRAIGEKNSPAVTLGVVFVLVGFAFKVSAVPFHMWAPDTYEGAPTPVTAFLAVASKAAGFVALIQVIGQALVLRMNVMIPVVAVLAALSMTIGNLIALRQTNVIRMLAYSGIAQAGFMLAPFVASQYGGIDAIVIYLVLYAATNLGAFAVVMAIARRTRSAEISSFGGLFSYSPGLAVALSVFLASFVGIPPLGIWYGKLSVMRALIESQGRWATVLAIFVALNTAIAAYYYLNVAKTMWFDDAPEGESTPIKVPTSLRFAVGIALVATIALGVYPGPLTDAATPEATPAAAPSGR